MTICVNNSYQSIPHAVFYRDTNLIAPSRLQYVKEVKKLPSLMSSLVSRAVALQSRPSVPFYGSRLLHSWKRILPLGIELRHYFWSREATSRPSERSGVNFEESSLSRRSSQDTTVGWHMQSQFQTSRSRVSAGSTGEGDNTTSRHRQGTLLSLCQSN
nr:hypothetical protein CFP56_57609 [Quercus suber]